MLPQKPTKLAGSRMFYRKIVPFWPQLHARGSASRFLAFSLDDRAVGAARLAGRLVHMDTHTTIVIHSTTIALFAFARTLIYYKSNFTRCLRWQLATLFPSARHRIALCLGRSPMALSPRLDPPRTTMRTRLPRQKSTQEEQQQRPGSKPETIDLGASSGGEVHLCQACQKPCPGPSVTH